MARHAHYTSISPKDVPAQVTCMESWAQAGLEVVTLNHPAEADALRPHMPDWIELCEVDFTPRLAKPLLPLSLLFRTIAERHQGAETRVSFSNADITLLTPDLMARCDALQSDFIFASRTDFEGDTPAGRYTGGFDFFHFDPARMDFPELEGGPLHIGVPWWDHVLPFVAITHALRVGRIDDDVIGHQKHLQNWSEAAYITVGCQFFSTIAGHRISPEGIRQVQFGQPGRALRNLLNARPLADPADQRDLTPEMFSRVAWEIMVRAVINNFPADRVA